MDTKVLIVDDYTPLRKAAIMTLKENGFENVLEAESPEEGMRIFKEHKPDLVILDIIMPTLEGTTMVGKIKRINPKTQVVMLTLLTGDAPKQESMDAGAELYLTKPLTSAKVDEIKRVLEAGRIKGV